MEKNRTRREVCLAAGPAIAALGVPVSAFGATAPSQIIPSGAEISHSSAAIHQEVDFSASPARLYRALTLTEDFDRVVQLSSAMNTDMKKMLGSAPTKIDPQPGGAFVLFGGYITGRMLDLVPDTRIVQAWRAGSWEPGAFSIATFAILPRGAGCRLVFDHTGFPNDAAVELAKGWHVNYWEPLARALA
jgi:uncharacterized protein YndB with AHSA1/START domain